jgi:hypothetical protein
MTLHRNIGAGWIFCQLAVAGTSSAAVFVSPEINTTPTPENFSICYGNSCRSISQLALPDSEWRHIQAIFLPAATSAAKEREMISTAVARLEQLIGAMTGTGHDRGRNESSSNPLDHRMDCIDESTNTTTYLYMLQQGGLLHWHRLRDPATRGFFFFGWPHTTAVIEAQNDRRLWAVDSWFHDNGEPPEILPLEQWRQGWSPTDP